MDKQLQLERYTKQYIAENIIIDFEDSQVKVLLFKEGKCFFMKKTVFEYDCFDEYTNEGVFESTEYHPDTKDFLDNISETSLPKLWSAIIRSCELKLNQ